MLLAELIGSTYGRTIGYTYSQVFKLTKLYPSNIQEIHENVIDPFVTFTVSPKYSQAKTHKIIENYCNDGIFQTVTNNYLVQNRINKLSTAAYWHYSQKNLSWYLNLYTLYNDYRWLQYVPGIDKIGISGSTAIQSTEFNGDIDLVILTKKYWTWFVRTYIKIILKIQGNDVNVWFLQLIIDIIKLLNTFGNWDYFTNQEQFLRKIIWKKKHSKTSIDIGFVSDNIKNLTKNYPNQPHNITFMFVGFFGSGVVEHFDEYKYQKVNSHTYFFVKVVEILVFPIALLCMGFIFYYKLKSYLGYRMIISSSTISFYPQIYTDNKH